MAERLFENFISFEGIDFSGKTTQIKRLMDRFQVQKFPAMLLREPGGTPISESIRSVLLDKRYIEMHARTEILLYSAARAQLVHEKILPLLASGNYIIADRFYDSTTAYQGYGRALDLDFVRRLNDFATSLLTPFKTIFLDITPEEAARRRGVAGRGKDRMESEDAAFYHTIRQAYLEMIHGAPDRFILLDGARPMDEIADNVWKEILQIWPAAAQ